MSEFYRDNTLWESTDGTWNLGFFKAFVTGSGENFDPNWDIEYDHDLFSWVSTGHTTPEEAQASWTGEAVPFNLYPNKGNESHCSNYDGMARHKTLLLVNK